jgi:hypothetical protein
MNFMPPPLRCLSIVGLSLALAACDTPPTMVEQHFGMAVQRAQAQQSQHSPAHQRTASVPDTDGASALSAMTRYQQSFQTPPAPATIFNIGLGAVSAP